MKTKTFKYIYKQLGCLIILSSTLMSCSDWTEVSPIEIKKQTIEDSDPALYAKYLEDLKSYKESQHTIVIGRYDNSVKVPFNQSHLISKVPDSLDYLVLKSPDNLSTNEISQLKDSQEKKGIKFLYDIDIDAYFSNYQQFTVDEKNKKTLLNYLTEQVNLVNGLGQKYPYNGVVISFSGRDTLHMTVKEKEDEKAIQGLFNSVLNNWKTANAGKELLYRGNPQSLIDKSVLSDVKYIILPTLNIISKEGLTFTLLNAIGNNISEDKFIIESNSISYKPEEVDKKMGYFANGDVATQGATQWILSRLSSDIQVKGLSIENLQYDYFNIIKSYQYSREAISSLNPSIK